jgi:hypothetical protein
MSREEEMNKVEFSRTARMPFASRYDNYFGGKWVAPVSGQYFENISPVNGMPIGTVARGADMRMNRMSDGKVMVVEPVPDTESADKILAQGVDVEPLAGNQRDYAGPMARIVIVMCIVYTLFHIIVMNFYPLEPWAYRLIHVTGGLANPFSVARIPGGQGGVRASPGLERGGPRHLPRRLRPRPDHGGQHLPLGGRHGFDSIRDVTQTIPSGRRPLGKLGVHPITHTNKCTTRG